MNFLFGTSRQLRKTGMASLSLVAGVFLGVYAYHMFMPLLGDATKPRAIAERGPLISAEQTVVDLFDHTAPSVVFITTKKRGWYMQRWNVQEVAQGSGSGFIWDEFGHIVTNYHVIQSGNLFEVILFDQSSYDAKLVGIYPDKDLAVLRINAPRDKLHPIPLGSTKDLRVGQSVMAIGNPFGLDHSLTTGVVSALDRTLESVNQRKISGMIQTDAAINPGNSGGPLLDSAGRLIGVNTQIYSTSGSSAGIGFAIPVDIVNDAVPLLIRDGEIKRPGLGIYAYPNNARLMRYLRLEGLLIQDVARGSSAEKAGLRGVRYRRDGSPVIGDIITDIDGKPVKDLQDLSDILDGYKVGDQVKIGIIRDNNKASVNAQLQPIN